MRGKGIPSRSFSTLLRKGALVLDDSGMQCLMPIFSSAGMLKKLRAIGPA